MKTKIKTETMKDLTKIYIDLSKCTEEQRKSLPQILVKNRQEYTPAFNDNISASDIVHFHNKWKIWALSVGIPDDKQELTYPEFIKLFEGGDGERTELLPDVAYWRHRCLLAEKCLSVSPCDPDITEEQIKAHKDYNQYLETFGNKD